MEDGMDWMELPGECNNQPAPLLINISGGAAGTGFTGTDSLSRKLDYKVWINRQMYIVSAGNDGPGAATIGRPAVAKNAFTVGNVYDSGYQTAGDVTTSSSRGPTGDGRMKPNVVAPGHTVTSAWAGHPNLYTDKTGTSMAAPHVTGLAATLMEHYPSFQFNRRCCGPT
jgi:serine protease AprX